MNFIDHSNLSLIPAESAQAPAVRELVNSSYGTFFNTFLESGRLENVRLKSDEDVLQLIKNENYKLYVLVDKVQNTVLGTICYVPNKAKKSAWFGLFSLNSSLRGTNVGSQMVQHMESIAKENGKIKMKLDVSGFATSLQRNYQRMGYKQTGKTIPFSQNIHWILKEEYQESPNKDFLVFSKHF